MFFLTLVCWPVVCKFDIGHAGICSHSVQLKYNVHQIFHQSSLLYILVEQCHIDIHFHKLGAACA